MNHSASAFPKRSVSPRADRLVRLASWASFIAASFMVMLRAMAWQATDSLAVLGSLLDSLLDTAVSLMIFFAVRYATTPADEEHRFGHGKAEPVAALFQGGMMAAASLFLLWNASARIFRPDDIENVPYGIAVVLISIAITLALVWFQRYVVRQTGSLAIESDSLHYRADFFLHLATIIGLGGAGLLSVIWIDSLAAVAISLYFGWQTWKVIKNSLAQLMDRELSLAERERIKSIVTSHPRVHNIHDLRTRLAGRKSVIQFHIELDRDISLMEAHHISDEVEESILRVLPGADIIIHQDPEGVEKLTPLEVS